MIMKKNYLLMESHLEVDELQKSKTRRLYVFLFSVLLLISIFPLSKILAQDVSLDNWTFYAEVNGVKVYYQFSECGGSDEFDPDIEPAIIPVKSQVLILKFENTNLQDVTLNWNKELKSNSNSQNNIVHQSEVFITNCTNSPKIKLASEPNDNMPISAIEALDFLQIHVTFQ